MLVKLDHLPRVSGWTFQKYLSCHHPVIHANKQSEESSPRTWWSEPLKQDEQNNCVTWRGQKHAWNTRHFTKVFLETRGTSQVTPCFSGFQKIPWFPCFPLWWNLHFLSHKHQFWVAFLMRKRFAQSRSNLKPQSPCGFDRSQFPTDRRNQLFIEGIDSTRKNKQHFRFPTWSHDESDMWNHFPLCSYRFP